MFGLHCKLGKQRSAAAAPLGIRSSTVCSVCAAHAADIDTAFRCEAATFSYLSNSLLSQSLTQQAVEQLGSPDCCSTAVYDQPL